MQGRNLYGGGYNPGGQYAPAGAGLQSPLAGVTDPSSPNGQFQMIANLLSMGPQAQQMQQQQTSGNAFQAFMDWFGGQQQWEPGAAMMDFTGRAPFNPQTGANLGGPTDLGAFYGGQGVAPPVLGTRGQSFLPGYQNLGTSYSTSLMQNNPGLFMAELQQQQAQNPGQTMSGTPSPFLPPQLTGGAAAQNPAPAAYADLGIHQGPGAFGGSRPTGSGGGQAPRPAPAAQAPGHSAGANLQNANLAGAGGGRSGGGNPQQSQQMQQLGQLLNRLLGGGGSSPLGGLMFGAGGGNLQGVAQLLAFIQQLRGQFGNVGSVPQRPPVRNRMFTGGSNYLYPAGYGPAHQNHPLMD